MDLKDYVRILRKRWLSIVALTALALAAAAAATMRATPEYQAHTTLFVSTQGAATSSDLLQGNAFVQDIVQSYADIVNTDIVLSPVIRDLGLDTTSAELARQVTADAPLDRVVINISVSDSSAAQAAQIANAVGASLISTVGDLERTGTTSDPVLITTTQPAVTPTTPTSPNPGLNLGLGLLVGLAVGVGTAVLREAWDASVRSEHDLADLGVPVLAGMPYDSSAERSPLVFRDDPTSVRAENFRKLRTNLHFATAANGARSILITSTVQGEGKTTTAINLALTLGSAGLRVVLVDADLRRPMVASYLDLEGAVGLTTVLVGSAKPDDVTHLFGEVNPIAVMAAGDTPPNPSELLGSEPMLKILQELESRYDFVILDGAPLLAVTDSAVLAGLTGGTVVVVANGRTKRPQLVRALHSLSAVGAGVLGAVATMLPVRGVDAYETYSYPAPEAEERDRRRGQQGRRR